MMTAQAPTLIVLQDGTPIFTSYGKWLYPLFEKAAALLIYRLGFRTVQAGILSRLGEAVLQHHGIAYTYEQLVDRIHCQTEELLATVEDPEAAYRLVQARAGR